MFLYLLTVPCSPGNDKQASSDKIICVDFSTISGLIITISPVFFSHLFPLFHCVVATIFRDFPTCGAASHTHSYIRISSSKSYANLRISGVISSILSADTLKIGLFAHNCRG